MLRTENLLIRRGSKTVLSDINLELKPGKSSACWGRTVPAKVHCSARCAVNCTPMRGASGLISRSCGIAPAPSAPNAWRCYRKCRPWTSAFVWRKWSAWAACPIRPAGCAMMKSSPPHWAPPMPGI